MRQTEKRHWENGFQVRGKNFKTFNMSVFNLGIMFSGVYIPKVSIFYLI